MNTKVNNQAVLELLAPAGSKEAFIAALNAGADAVYIGVGKFNARQYAQRFSADDVAVMIHHAHSLNRKVYLAFNTLIKTLELPAALKTLAILAEYRPDGLIIQDYGLIKIVKDYFPGIPLHASTQMAVHNKYGVEFLAGQGFKRVILARELALTDLKRLRTPGIELEIFCHGALCFSMSGQCMFSSIIGGHSGNRGRCTQPCRRRWLNPSSREEGYYFSPHDLQLAEHVLALKDAGVKALKIEGRMRSSEYVYRVVKAYRMIIDAGDASDSTIIAEALKLLSEDWSREKTVYNFVTPAVPVIDPLTPSTLGKFVGTVTASGTGTVKITAVAGNSIVKNDRLRINIPGEDVTSNIKPKTLTPEPGGTYEIVLSDNTRYPVGARIYKVGDAGWDAKGIEHQLKVMHKTYAAACNVTDDDRNMKTLAARRIVGKIVATYQKQRSAVVYPGGKTLRLWLKVSSPEWCDIIIAENIVCERLNLSLTQENMYTLKNYVLSLNEQFIQKIVFELPPYIPERSIREYQIIVHDLISAGMRSWVVNNPGHLGFFKGITELNLTSGPFMYCLNPVTAQWLNSAGISAYTTSWEDEYANIQALTKYVTPGNLVVYLYGYPVIARTRMKYGGIENIKVTDKLNRDKFRTVTEGDTVILLPQVPVSLFHLRDSFKLLGISNYGIDLSYTVPSKEYLHQLLDVYKRNARVSGSGGSEFNYTRGLR
ncbi:MAG: peptidase U32 family protein [Elusimicrobiota bacterium]